jgi:hypothetical protein
MPSKHKAGVRNMSRSVRHRVSSNPNTQFFQALAINEITPVVAIPLPSSRTPYLIEAITLVSVQALAWELWLFTRAGGTGLAPGVAGSPLADSFLASWQFLEPVVGPPASPGFSAIGAGAAGTFANFRYYVDGNQMPYQDETFMEAGPASGGFAFPALYVALINRSAAGKLADVAGAVKVIFHLSQQDGQ